MVPPEFADAVEEVEVCPSYERIAVVPAEFRYGTKRVMTDPVFMSI